MFLHDLNLKMWSTFVRFYENIFTLVSKVIIFFFISCACGGDWLISFFWFLISEFRCGDGEGRDNEVE